MAASLWEIALVSTPAVAVTMVWISESSEGTWYDESPIGVASNVRRIAPRALRISVARPRGEVAGGEA